ncbi:PEGA domain-containing protein [Deinococcus detaillensis]|uniref:PEGA domain-containing protein n=1 Tax=Deinococcus detaillensis TaxID=2592048 RepID=A0A553US57_9DEIO|nr:PEGA domain-containing protein [Deinococcus detaillensis]TSA83056.1 PEGA domain-containing protein [Deinococcus detaillensis]
MKTVGPFVAARPLDSRASGSPARPVVTLHALDRLTGMPALVYLLPQFLEPLQLPNSPSLLPYLEAGQQGQQAYLACELPPHAGLASDPLQTALGGLRALNALHEAGLIHGGVEPYQLWEWDGVVRLAGAGLPWGEAAGALAAPEGGSSPAADLYALGVTLLRMGPLPVGLSDLLSPYPAQRPSARDALARMNAGPPLPSEPGPLMVQAPLHPRTEPVISEPVILPLIADPDEPVGARNAAVHNHSVPILGWDEVDIPESSLSTLGAAEPAPPAQEQLLSQTTREAGESELLDFLAAFPTGEEAAHLLVAGASPVQGADLPAADSVVAASLPLADEALARALDEAVPDKAPIESVVGTGTDAEPASPEQSPEPPHGLGDSAAVLESAETMFLAWPSQPEDASRPTEPLGHESAPDEPMPTTLQTPEPASEPYDSAAGQTIILAAEPPPLNVPSSSAEPSPAAELAASTSIQLAAEQPTDPQPDLGQPDSIEPSRVPISESTQSDENRSSDLPAPTAVSPRQLRPVKIGWSQDGSWQVKKGAREGGNQLAGAGGVVGSTVAPASDASDSLPPFVRQTSAAPAASGRFNPLWLLLLVMALVLVVVLARTAFRSSSAALSASACCTVSARVVGSSGQSLSAPVRVSVSSAPVGSRLSAGTLVGQAPGPLALDVPGAYALKVEGDGYAAQTVNVTVPATQPLTITLQ